MEQKPAPQVVGPSSIPSAEAFGTPTLWSTYSFAPEWFRDALREAASLGHEARRREILFAVCAAESYIFEWVRDTVLNRDFGVLATYFPPDMRRGVTEKLRDIPKQLAKDGRLRASLDCGGHEWQDFRALVDFRDGLVHASASHPETTSLPRESRPITSKADLDSLPAGRAVAIVRTLLMKLHIDTNTSPPTWL